MLAKRVDGGAERGVESPDIDVVEFSRYVEAYSAGL
jgi:hypothetical protein